MISPPSLMPPFARAMAAVAIASASLLAGCGEAQKQAAPPPPKVTVAKPIKRTIVDQDEYVGRFVPVDVVEIRARVSGYLDKLHFTDGQIVKQGDLLFTIDNRPYQNTLDQARANLETAKSNLAFTQSDLARGQQLVRERTISEPRHSVTRRLRWRRTRRWCAKPSLISNIPNSGRRSPAASATAA